MLFLLITSHKVTLCEPHLVCGFSKHFSFDFPVTLFCCVALNVTVVDSQWNSCAGKKNHEPEVSLRNPMRLDDCYYAAECLCTQNLKCTLQNKIILKVNVIFDCLGCEQKCFHFWCCGTFQRAILSAVRMDWKPFTSMQYPAQKACLCNMSTWQSCHHSTRHQCFSAIQV